MDSEKIPFCKVNQLDYKSIARKRRLNEFEEIYEYVNLNGIYFYVDSQGKISCCTANGRNAMSTKMISSRGSDVYVPYIRPEKVSLFESTRRGLYDPQTKAILGRTLKGWGGILTFYFVFLSALAALFAICMYVVLCTLSPEYPRYQLTDSLIGTNPGLGFRPYSGDVEKHGSLIWYVASNESNVLQWTRVLDDFLQDYIETKQRENKVICDFDRPPASGKVCSVNVDDFGPCSKEKGYSYNQSAPCIFIKLNRMWLYDIWITLCHAVPNDFGVAFGYDQWLVDQRLGLLFLHNLSRCVIFHQIISERENNVIQVPKLFRQHLNIFNWIPEYYNNTENLPEGMDEDLKLHITETTPAERNVVWITCYGENPADRENLGGVKYFPKRGFPGYYYPFTNTPGYLSPLVAVHFERPALHTLINVECRAWAKNIEYKRAFQHREGSVHFELLID